MTFGQQLLAWLGDRHMSQTELGRASGMSRQRVGQLVHGDNYPLPKVQERIFAGLDVTKEEFFRRDFRPEPLTLPEGQYMTGGEKMDKIVADLLWLTDEQLHKIYVVVGHYASQERAKKNITSAS